MITATYTDPTTNWADRVKVEGTDIPPSGSVWIADADGREARIDIKHLSEFHREQGEDREYLPAWWPTGLNGAGA
jgi:hypothetical protein